MYIFIALSALITPRTAGVLPLTRGKQESPRQRRLSDDETVSTNQAQMNI